VRNVIIFAKNVALKAALLVSQVLISTKKQANVIIVKEDAIFVPVPLTVKNAQQISLTLKTLETVNHVISTAFNAVKKVV